MLRPVRGFMGEHALTIGYRASLTEIVQIIGRATRDAPGKARARFTNLIAEPDASAEVRLPMWQRLAMNS